MSEVEPRLTYERAELVLPQFGNGEVARLIDTLDWSASPLGPPGNWPQALKTTVGLILPAAAQIVLFWGPEFIALYNDAYAPTIGAKHPQALGRPAKENWSELWDDLGPLLHKVRDTGQTLFAKDRPFYIERHGYPETVYFDISYSAVPDETGAVGGVLCIVSETTDRVLSEKQNLQDRERLTRMFEQSPTFTAMMIGPQHIFEIANPAYRHLVGGRDLVGKPVREALPDIAGQGFFELLDEVYRTGKPHVGLGTPVLIERHVGKVEERYLDFVYQPIVSSGGQVTGILVQGSDVTERKHAEQALNALNETLENRVAQEIARRSQAEEVLRQAQKMETVGQLSGGIAHDFNNLLQVIHGNLSMLKHAIPETEAKWQRSVANALSGTERAAALTQRLLAFSRRQPLAPQTVNINHLIVDMTDILQSTLGEPVEIRTHLSSSSPKALVDKNQLENAILNLAINARDAMPNGGTLEISTDVTELDDEQQSDRVSKRYVRIAVVDNGTGMNPDVLSRAVEPFFSTKEVGQGTGLGLSTVYGFAKQSGGHLLLQSRENKGTKVEILLPSSEQASESSELEGAIGELPKGRGERVLVCEDDGDVRLFSSETLRDLGYNVIEAHDVRSALASLLEHGRVDLLFTDVILPGGRTGADLAREARKLQPDLKVLFTTGYARSALDSPPKAEKSIELLLKPFGVDELASRIRQILG